MAALVALLGLFACSSSGSGRADAGPSVIVPDGDLVSCAADPRADAYMPNLTKPGESGLITFVLVSSSRVPPAVDTNVWTIKLLDAGGQPVKDAKFPTIKTWMPDHAHGSSAAPAAMSNGDGTYTISPLYLFMPGVWEITFTAKSGAVTDVAKFTFCVGG